MQGFPLGKLYLRMGNPPKCGYHPAHLLTGIFSLFKPCDTHMFCVQVIVQYLLSHVLQNIYFTDARKYILHSRHSQTKRYKKQMAKKYKSQIKHLKICRFKRGDVKEVVGEREVEVDGSDIGDVGCLEVNNHCQMKDQLLLRSFWSCKLFGN